MPRAKDLTAQRELLDRVLGSPQFASADSLRRMLEYLFDRLHEPEGTPLKEHEIAVQALHRSADFDPKIDPIIRVNMAAVRARLRAYFDGVGRNEPMELVVPRGQYRLCFVERSPQRQEGENGRPVCNHGRRFWKPYLSGYMPNILIYSELLFFRDHRGNYVRSIYVNNRTTGLTELGERFPEVRIADLKPSFHFVSAGEMRAILEIEDSLREMGAPIKVRDSRFISWSDMQRSNLIILGGSRTNPFLASLQGRECFVVAADCIENLAPRSGEERQYRGQQFMDGGLERVVEYAVVTRRPGVAGGGPVTIIAANHGRAIQGAGVSLVREDKLGSTFEAMGQAQASVLPAHFQVLLRIDMIDYDEEVVNVEYVAHRVFE